MVLVSKSGDVVRYRLRMSRTARVGCSVLYAVIGVVLAVGAVTAGVDTAYRVVCVIGLGSVAFSLRAILGTVIVARDDALVVQRYWPVRRVVPWYRIEVVDVLPGFWNLELQLNSGERIELPPVDELDELFRLVEHQRTHLDV